MRRPRLPAGRGPRRENVVWIFGFGRSGTTWLSRLLAGLDRCHVWNEPLIGHVLALASAGTLPSVRANRAYILGDPPAARNEAIRGFFNAGARARLGRIGRRDIVVVKEPHGSHGARQLAATFPESRIVLLLRDPHDVFASLIDGLGKDAWASTAFGIDGSALADDPQRLEVWARAYAEHTDAALDAYEAHRGPKTLIRYEDLWRQTEVTLRRALVDLGLEMSAQRLAEVVEQHSWERIPEEEKGPGRFYRRGEPGGWHQKLTAQQIDVVKRHAGRVIDGFYAS